MVLGENLENDKRREIRNVLFSDHLYREHKMLQKVKKNAQKEPSISETVSFGMNILSDAVYKPAIAKSVAFRINKLPGLAYKPAIVESVGFKIN